MATIFKIQATCWQYQIRNYWLDCPDRQMNGSGFTIVQISCLQRVCWEYRFWFTTDHKREMKRARIDGISPFSGRMVSLKFKGGGGGGWQAQIQAYRWMAIHRLLVQHIQLLLVSRKSFINIGSIKDGSIRSILQQSSTEWRRKGSQNQRRCLNFVYSFSSFWWPRPFELVTKTTTSNWRLQENRNLSNIWPTLTDSLPIRGLNTISILAFQVQK